MRQQLEQSKDLIQAGRFAAAEALLLDVLGGELDAGPASEARYMLAVSRRYQKNLTGALKTLDELLGVDRRNGRAYQERGYTLLAMNRPDDAAGAFARAVSLNPGLLSSWRMLVGLHRRAGRDEEAARAGREAARLEALPRELRAVIDLLHDGKLLRAETLCRHYLQSNPRDIEAMRLLADIAVRLHVYDDAEFLLESCVELDPDHSAARSDYVAILNRKGKFALALEQAEILLEREPGRTVHRIAASHALAGVGRLEEAVDGFRQALETTGNRPGVLVMLGHAEKARGRFEEAVAAYREACRLRPGYGDAWWSLANTKTYRFDDDELAAIEDHEAKPDAAVDDRIHLCFAAGKAHEDRRDYAPAFDYYERGNALRRERAGYDPDRTSALVDAQIESCNGRLFRERGALGCESPGPIFIVGLPRAGSTLLEQVLASHPQVDGTMELHEILGLAQRLRGRGADDAARYPANLATIDGDYFARFGQRYLDDTQVYRGDAPFFVDKMPNNFLHVGLIRLILPNARVIDARRHPMACCFSAFKQLFGDGHDFSYDLATAGRYYRDYVRLMQHWDRVLPGFVLRVDHEAVVEDLESQVRRLLDFCQLPFDAQCLEFHRNERAVRTPSSQQVRQPIYRTGLEHWRHFEPWLDPLREALGAGIRREYGLGRL